MKLISLLGMIATIASGYSLENSEIEEEKIAEIATDIFVEQQGNRLVFKKISGGDITEELLTTDLLVAPFIVFSVRNGCWFAEQTDNIDFFKRMLRAKEKEKSYRYAIIGADKINGRVNEYHFKFDSYYGTLLVELSGI